MLWLFISNMIQIMLMPLIMVGQNLEITCTEIRLENYFNVNVKAEKEIILQFEEMKELTALIPKLTQNKLW